jgi:hypothetical protein
VQHDGCEVILLDRGFSPGEDTDRLLCLIGRHEVPVVDLIVPGLDAGRETIGSDSPLSRLPLELSLYSADLANPTRLLARAEGCLERAQAGEQSIAS